MRVYNIIDYILFALILFRRYYFINTFKMMVQGQDVNKQVFFFI